MTSFDYTENDLVNALKSIEITSGDSIFIHSNIGFFGKLKNASSANDYYKIFKKAIFDVITQNGTLVVPTFSYSFCNNMEFDKKNTKSVCGLLSEMVRLDDDSYRSNDPNFSVCAIGKNAEYYTSNLSFHSFGKNSFWEKFLEHNGKICRFNLGPEYNTFVHFVEKKLNVPYRYDKAFSGILVDGQKINATYYHFVRDLENENHITSLQEFEQIALKNNSMKKSFLGKGNISSISTSDVLQIILEHFTKNPNFLIKGN